MRKTRRKKTEIKIKKRRIARREWDFTKIKPEDREFVCMREYARECLRCWDANEFEFPFLTQGLNACMPATGDPSGVLNAIRRGLEARANGEKPPRRKATPTVVEVPSYRAWRPAQTLPPGYYVVCLQIDWRAGNKEIKKALENWLEAHVRSEEMNSEANEAYLRHLSSQTQPLRERDELVDYCEAANAIATFSSVSKARRWPIKCIIEELRRGVGSKRGRGDAKAAMLTNLAVYRLHRAGYSELEVRKLLGKERLKYHDLGQIRRTVRSVESQLGNMMLCAELVEKIAVGREKKAQIVIPEAAFRRTSKT